MRKQNSARSQRANDKARSSSARRLSRMQVRNFVQASFAKDKDFSYVREQVAKDGVIAFLNDSVCSAWLSRLAPGATPEGMTQFFCRIERSKV